VTFSVNDSYAIIGVDPGTMTGIFVYQRCDSPCCEGVRITPLQVPADNVWGKLRQGGIKFDKHCWDQRRYYAVERFIITSKTAKLTQNTDALEVTGMVRAASHITQGNGLVRYAKANLKFASDDMLRKVGWYTPAMGHANDAARQAFALLKDVDYPRWSELVRDAMMEPTTEG
jgi:hypothetical protein